MPRAMRKLAWIAVLVAACGDNLGPRTGGDDDGTTDADFTQAIGGAMWVDPDAYATIPIHVHAAAPVTISVDGAPYATTATGDVYTALVPTAGFTDGEHTITAGNATATLVAGRDGMQWTQIGVDGNAATPRLHRLGGKLAMTWTAGSPRTAWLQLLDGAGRKLGEPTALVGGTDDVLYARTAFGAPTDGGSDSIGVLFQRRGGPYTNFFTVVTSDGAERVAPIALDGDRLGSYSGDVVFANAGYDLVWRTNDGAGSSDIRWMHVDEATGTVTGPIVVATKGNDDPNGGFDPITNVTIHPAGLVAFSRYLYDPTLELEILKCQLATITNAAATTAVVAPGFTWDDDCRILDDGTGPVIVRTGKDLTSSADNPPDEMFASRIPLGTGTKLIVSAPESREEPVLVGTSAAPILAWTDARSYAVDITHGEVELYAAVLGADLVAGDNIRFAHSHVVEGTADLRAAPAGENAIVTWVDERHGGSVVDPKPEVYLETIWQ